MHFKGLLKRVGPFFLTFALGLLVASFFVTVAAPNFQFKKRGHRCREYRENYRLRMENESLKRQLASREFKTVDVPSTFEYDLAVPPPPPMPAAAPRISEVPRVVR